MNERTTRASQLHKLYHIGLNGPHGVAYKSASALIESPLKFLIYTVDEKPLCAIGPFLRDCVRKNVNYCVVE